MGCRMPGRVVDLTKAQASEEPMRNLYRRWAQFMEADSWDELMTWRRDAAREAQGGGMSDPINIRDLAVGTRVVLGTGAEVEIVANPQRRRVAVRPLSVVGRRSRQWSGRRR